MAPSPPRGLAIWSVALWTILLAFIATTASALDESQAGIIDWHHRWIGTPKMSANVRNVRGSNTVYVATDKNVVASVKAKSGELLWRQVLREDEPVHAIRTHAGHVVALTGTKDFHVRLLDAKTGQPHWDFTPSGEGSSEFGQAVTTTKEDGHLIVLNEGAHVRKLNSKSGIQIWHWKAQAGSPTTYFSVLEANGFAGSEDVIYVLGLQRGIAAYSLEVVALESATGKYIKTFNIKSKIDTITDVLTLGGGTPHKAGYVAWLEQDYLKVLTLGTEKTTQSTLKIIISHVPAFEQLQAPLAFVDLGLPEGYTEFLLAGTVGEYNDAKAAVLLNIDASGKADIVYDFGERTGFSAWSATTLPGTEEVVVLRAYRDDPEVAVLEVVNTKERKITLEQQIPLDFDKFAHFTFASLELYNKGQGIQTRAYFSTLDGSFHAFSDVEFESWYREESLAYAKDVEIVDLPERKLWTQDVDETGHVKSAKNESIVAHYIERLTSHVLQLKDLPAFMLSYANPSSLFTRAPVAVPYSEVEIGVNKTIQPLYRDQFGLRKILIFSTEKGKIVAVDSANKGQIIWSRLFSMGHDIKNVVVVRHANVRLPPVLAVIAQTEDGGNNKVIRMYRIDALTGKDYESGNFFFPAAAWIPAGYLSAFKLPLEDPEEKTQVLCLVDDRMHITTFPTTDAVEQAFKALSDDFYFTLESKVGAKEINGYKAIVSAETDRMDVEPTWNIPFPAGEEIFENNVVYTFWSEGETSTSAKGYQAVSLELYESDTRNQRTKSDTFSSFTAEKPHVIAQSFPFSQAPSAIGVTTTKAGISAKDILFGLSRHTIMAVNHRFLDPRRPTAAPTALEKEEMLIPYSPIPDDARLYLSYNLEVANVKKIVTSPTLLESTTVVVAFGQDVFVTRHAPSKTFDILNEDFSKAQLMLTMVALVVVLFITKPMVVKKELKELWY
ncbi:hypothetical protein BGZ95_009165 [Linnemannia exigua]|uniref:ER membrane protein complex subunit 1 n=1 Tax=Linnemannia exigua TaxID=604196 RepID=A0AAD4H6Y4_9FUNG|nr:hypothetical protein BGZ95_009165 [Linnemannia exigua]